MISTAPHPAKTQAPISALPESNASQSIIKQILGMIGHRQILSLLVARDLSSRYRGSLLGRLWPLLHPLGQLIIYTFVFSIVLKIKFADSGSTSSFAIYFMAGLIPWSIFAESASRSSTVILENPNLVSKVVFPTEILPLVNVFSAFCTQFFAAMILLVCAAFYLGKVHSTVLFMPLIAFSLIAFASGVSWFLAALGVFIKDTKHIVSLALQAGMYATPILYPAKSVPPEYQWVLLINPLAGIVEDFRRVLLAGEAPEWPRFFAYMGISLLTGFIGLYFFLKTKKSFADVM